MPRLTPLLVASTVWLMASYVPAASVGFTGEFLSQNQALGGGVGSAFGAIPPAVAFSIQSITVAEGASTGAIGSSSLASHPNIGIASGTLTINENGTNDTAIFSLAIARDGAAVNGNIAMAFNGDLFTTNVISQATLSSLIASANSSAAITFSDSGNGQSSTYAGNVTAVVPEPSAALGIACLTGQVLLWRRRRKPRIVPVS